MPGDVILTSNFPLLKKAAQEKKRRNNVYSTVTEVSDLDVVYILRTFKEVLIYAIHNRIWSESSPELPEYVS